MPQGETMMATMPDTGLLQRRLDELALAHGVPGAVVGVLVGDEQVVCATGLTRLPDGAAVTADTLFLIASITKVWTATLVMQLVDEGRVELDEPVNRYLDPPLQIADTAALATITVRHLLTHSGGFFGDADEPKNRGDDAVRVTLDGYAELAQLHRPGTLFSYSNAGFNVLGRVVECVTGSTWDEALRERILEPLGLDNTVTLPEEAAARPIAVGHQPKSPDTLELEPVSVWLDPRGSGPCGGTLATTAGDLLGFARMHLRDGEGPEGKQVLRPQSARAMRQPQIIQPDPSTSPAWGLGWGVEREEGPVIMEHGGNTCGQQSDLVVVPELGVAFCVLTNGDTQGLLGKTLTSWLMRELVGVDRPGTPSPAAGGPESGRTLLRGSYRRSEEVRLEVEEQGGGLQLVFQTSGETAKVLNSFTCPLEFAGGTTFLFTLPRMADPITATFLFTDGADEPATHLAIGLRVAPRELAAT
jgi:CubicO group peptidase (beta-lactamase class C family)